MTTISQPAGTAEEPPADAPRPDVPLPRHLVTAASIAGLTCAVAVPLERPGVGFLVAGVVTAAGVAVAGRRTPGAVRALLPGAARFETLAWAAAAVALSGVAAVRAADWLTDLCLLVACLAGAMAVAGRLVHGLVRAAVSVPLGVLTAVPWLGRAVRRSFRADRIGPGLRLGASLVVGAILLVVFGSLLASADAVFADLVENVLPALDEWPVFSWVFLFGCGAATVAGAVFVLVAPPALALPRLRPTRLRTIDWAVPVGLLVALFALFVAIQFAALFGSDAYVQATTGLTFAEYARSGFWQLLMVSVLALGVIMAGIRWAPASSSGDRTTKRLLLGAMAVLCLVIVASALRRMWLYQQAYGFTVLRLLVGACELWLGLAFLLALVAVLRLRATGVARPMAVTAVAGLLVLAVIDPERFVAAQNVARFADTGRLDSEYLSRLSADAVPALVQLPESDERTCILATIAAANRPDDAEDWRSANLSRAAADDSIGHLADLASGVGGGDPVFGADDGYGGSSQPVCSLDRSLS